MGNESPINREALTMLTEKGRLEKAERERNAEAARELELETARELRQQRIASEIAKRLARSLPQIDKEITSTAAEGKDKLTKTFTVKHTSDTRDRFGRYPSLYDAKIEEETEVTLGVVAGITDKYNEDGLTVATLKPQQERENIIDRSEGVPVGSYIRHIDYGVEISWVEPTQG